MGDEVYTGVELVASHQLCEEICVLSCDARISCSKFSQWVSACMMPEFCLGMSRQCSFDKGHHLDNRFLTQLACKIPLKLIALTRYYLLILNAGIK
jgi:hypothetical protein